jgi:hypothetical protein
MKTLNKANKNLLKELTKKLGNLRSDRSRNAHQIRLTKKKIAELYSMSNSKA